MVILLEAIHNSSRYEQIYTMFEAVGESIDEIVNKGDKVKLIAFSLRGSDTKILHDINDDFTVDASLLNKALSQLH